MPEGRFPDVEAAVGAVIAALSDGRVNDATPANLDAAMPFQRVERSGGADDGVTDAAIVEVEAFASTRAEALALAEDQRQLLLAGPHAVTLDGHRVLLDRATTSQGPTRRPWGNENVHRFGGTYRITARRS